MTWLQWLEWPFSAKITDFNDFEWKPPILRGISIFLGENVLFIGLIFKCTDSSMVLEITNLKTEPDPLSPNLPYII